MQVDRKHYHAIAKGNNKVVIDGKLIATVKAGDKVIVTIIREVKYGIE